MTYKSWYLTQMRSIIVNYAVPKKSLKKVAFYSFLLLEIFSFHLFILIIYQESSTFSLYFSGAVIGWSVFQAWLWMNHFPSIFFHTVSALKPESHAFLTRIHSSWDMNNYGNKISFHSLPIPVTVIYSRFFEKFKLSDNAS